MSAAVSGPSSSWLRDLSLSRPSLRRPVSRALGLGVVCLLAANAWAFTVVSNRVTPVSVDSAVERYRETTLASTTATGAGEAARTGEHATLAVPQPVSQPEGPGTGPIVRNATDAVAGLVAAGSQAGPRPGVYVYATSGFEEVSVASTRHTYPAETTMTVTPGSCGAEVRWDVFEERWDRWTLCTPGAQIEVREFETYHEFFEQVERRTYACAPGTDFRPADAKVGTRTTGRCESHGAVVDMTATVTAIEDVVVGSTRVSAVRVRLDEMLSGDTRGTRSSDSWYAADSGLLIRRIAKTSVDTKAVFGDTHYSEELTLDLTDLEPRA